MRVYLTELRGALLAEPLEYQITLSSIRSHQKMVAHLHAVARSPSPSFDIKSAYQSRRQQSQLDECKVPTQARPCPFGEGHEIFLHGCRAISM